MWTCPGKVESSPEMKGEPTDEAQRFTKEFEDEAEQLAATSGRMQREIAVDP